MSTVTVGIGIPNPTTGEPVKGVNSVLELNKGFTATEFRSCVTTACQSGSAAQSLPTNPKTPWDPET